MDVTFPLGLPKTRQEHLALADKIAKRMRDGKEREHVDGVAIQVFRQEMPPLATDEELYAFVRASGRRLQNRLNGHVSSVFNKKHLLSVCVSSNRPTRMAASIYASIKRGCEQLSQQRAGHVWTHFLDLNDRELVKLIGGTRNALNGISARIFRNEDRRAICRRSGAQL